MVIGVDGNEANVQQKVGVSVYTYQLLYYFSQKSNNELQFIVYLRDHPRVDLPSPTKYFQYRIAKGDFLWSQLFLPLHLYFKRDIDVFFSPAHYAPRWCPVPTVVAIHDLSYFYYPDEFLKKDLYQLKNWTKYSVEKATKIIAVSKTTKKDLMKFYQIPDEKIEIVYNGFSRIIPSGVTDNQQQKAKSKKPYILYVGTLQPRKNLIRLIEAFNLLLKEKPEYSLIIVGKKGWLYEKIFGKVRELNLEARIIFTDYLPDEAVADLYQRAALFVLPSLYEGFGIPILEAMSHECPVITSSTASLSEIGGEACLYFNPQNPSELKRKMVEVLENQSLRQQLVKKGKERVKLFSWDRCGVATLKIIKNCVN